jgi:hypothetical protein
MNPYGLATVRLVVIVALADPQLDWLACRLHGRVEVPALALELGRLERTVGEDERGVQAVEMALRAELLLHRIGELDVTVALGERTGLRSYIPLPRSAPLRISSGSPPWPNRW